MKATNPFPSRDFPKRTSKINPGLILFMILAFISMPFFAGGQVLELSAFVGYRLGGNINTDPPEAGNLLVPNLDLKNSVDYGLIADINISEIFQITVVGDRQSTELLEDPRDGNPKEKRFDLNISYLQGGVTIQYPNRPLTAYVSLLAGAAFFDPEEGIDSEVRGSGSMMVGGKFYFSERLAVRLQTRFYSTYLGSNQDLFCDRNNEVCYQFTNSTFMTQVDFTAGFTVLF